MSFSDYLLFIKFQTNLANGLRVIDSNFEKGIWFKLYKLALWQVDELVPVKKAQRSVDKLKIFLKDAFFTHSLSLLFTGSLIPGNCVQALTSILSEGCDKSFTEKHPQSVEYDDNLSMPLLF